MTSNKKKTENNAEEIAVKLHELVARNPVVQIKRSQINFAEYNPRVMGEDERKGLGKGLDDFGLCETPCWNIRSGNLVGGHQRVKKLDKDSKGVDYLLWVTQVALDRKREIELNILLNNPKTQGDYDLEKLGNLFKVEDLDIEATGFDLGSIYQLLGDNPMKELPKEMQQLSDELMTRKKEHAEQLTTVAERDQADFYLVAVFKSNDEREIFTKKLSLPDNRYVDGRLLMEKITAPQR